MADNPYQAPGALGSAAVGGDAAAAATLASGQKLVIYAILLQFAVIVINIALARAGLPAALLAIAFALTALVMSLVGVWRIATGLGTGTAMKVVMLVLMFVPLVSLLMLLVINGRATRALREAGWSVGFLGATAPAG